MLWGMIFVSVNKYRVAILTASDKGSRGTRVDESGPLLQKMMEENGFAVADSALLADDAKGLSAQMKTWAESGEVDLILTTGGTGLSARDQIPEATMAIADRQVPGIPEALRAHSMQYTPRAMLGRAVSVVCKNTLVINLPGSPKAVKESMEMLLPVLEHAMEMLTGRGSECART